MGFLLAHVSVQEQLSHVAVGISGSSHAPLGSAYVSMASMASWLALTRTIWLKIGAANVGTDPYMYSSVLDHYACTARTLAPT